MTTRLLAAYAMIASIGLAALIALWVFVLREQLARRGRRNRYHRDRALAAQDAKRPPEAAAAD
ncbi:hypothetical protein [Sphingosinicella sp. YJ22]|uniref:hypothetical protein n=1 Tax=Sphingosinicella sp. YJ22 TaxID=1104780 RepID=UPI00140E8341|nr:hypothetical protein [Sphingosinicella sp. YJ22]